MSDEIRMLPRDYHDAVEHWQRHNFPEYPELSKRWQQYFPKDQEFCLCARLEKDMPAEIEVGDHKGKPKAIVPKQLDREAAEQLLMIIRAQASTEFGSIQQHHGTFERANDPQDQTWVLRVMAEELRHGYQMIHLLTSADWSSVTDTKPQDMVEEILSMRTGSHVLAAFNLEYDSFGDSIVFAAFIDRVGKYQLTMQKVNAYAPMAASMPPMLREEAFHLAAGVIPMRRWMEAAARDRNATLDVPMIQKMVNKWFARGLEMFGDERGGQTNVKLGLKDMANKEAQDKYIAECEKMIDDINERYVRARLEHLSREDALAAFARMKKGDTVEGIRRDQLLRLPDRRFFRRRGEPAFQMIGVDGEQFTDVEEYIAHCLARLPEAYHASIDVKHWIEMQRKVTRGEIELKKAIASMPRLARVGGACPCSKSVRWVMDVPEGASGGAERLHP
ncbi:MAG TPA: Phenylacetic acid catabolic protein [Candidatus Limnocylindria bacterium]|nr:Phenylacetic acid catabolic protein [Candidatus Limnocylindria bacterium]